MKITTFSAFKSRNYRLYFIGQSVSLIGTWMQKTAVSWVIYSLTHSTFMLGLTLFASQFPSFLFSLIGGVVSDRYNRFQGVVRYAGGLHDPGIYFGHIYSCWSLCGLGNIIAERNAGYYQCL